MTAASSFPDSVAEVASIHVSVGMDEYGTGCSYDLEGLSPESAIGYLTAVVDQLREEVRMRFEAARMEEYDAISVHITCPECGEDIDLTGSDDDDEDEDDE